MILLEKASRKPFFFAMTVLRYVSTWWHLVGSWDGERHKFWSFKQIYLNQRSEPMWSIIWNIPSFLENHLLSLFWNEALWCSYQTWHDAAWNDKRIEWNDVICRFCSCGAIFFRSTESRASLLNDCVLLIFFSGMFSWGFVALIGPTWWAHWTWLVH